MIARNHIFEIEFIKKTVLPTYRLTHHRPDPPAPSSRNKESRPSEPLKGLLQHPRPTTEVAARLNRVMGDNRGSSQDSRVMSQVGFMPAVNLVIECSAGLPGLDRTSEIARATAVDLA